MTYDYAVNMSGAGYNLLADSWVLWAQQPPRLSTVATKEGAATVSRGSQILFVSAKVARYRLQPILAVAPKYQPSQ